MFWVQDWRVPAVCLGSALSIRVLLRKLWRGRAIDWFDAVGLAAFGAAKSLGLGLGLGVPLLPAVTMGVITARVRGIIRDVLAGVPSILLHPKIYATVAALAAVLFIVLVLIGVPSLIASTVGATAGFGLRALAILRVLSIPTDTN